MIILSSLSTWLSLMMTITFAIALNADPPGHHLNSPTLNFQDALTNINTKLDVLKHLHSENNSFVSDYLYAENNKNSENQNGLNNNLNPQIIKTLNALVTESKSLTQSRISSECMGQLKKITTAISQKQIWPIKVLDAYGKLPSGILNGAFSWLGEFSECLNTTSGDQSWSGKYCLLTSQIQINPSIALPFKYGTCMPNSCTNDDVTLIVKFAIDLLPKNVTHNLALEVSCNEPKTLDQPAIIALSIIGFLMILILIGTVYELLKQIFDKKSNQSDSGLSEPLLLNENLENEHDESQTMESINIPIIAKQSQSKTDKLLLSWSVYANTLKIFKTNTNDTQLKCLHGIRFLSIAWVMLGHNFMIQLANCDNIITIIDWLKSFPFMVISNGTFSVDSFFLLSGLLTSYIFMLEITKTPLSFSFMAKYYIHRIWRITPAYMLVLMVSATLTKYLGDGPVYPIEGFEINGCNESWWTNLLYVNNFVNLDKPCLGVSWYLANDMQFHWIAPIILIPLALGKKVIGVLITLAMLIGSIVATALIINSYPGTELGMLSCRIGPFLIGLILGYSIFYHRQTNRFTMKKILSIPVWLLALGTMGLMIFGIYPNFNGSAPLSRIENILYQSTSRTLWAIGEAFLIFACITSNGGIVNRILCLKIWEPLSKLSFSLYLTHITILMHYIYTLEHPYHIQELSWVYLYCGHLLFSTVIAFFVSLIFESPFIGVEKLIFKRNN